MSTEDFLTEKGEFKCIKCGACCLKVDHIYPDLALEDGRCKHLTEDNLCAIYDTRPPLCRIPQELSDNYPRVLASACNIIRNYRLYGIQTIGSSNAKDQ